MTLISSRAHVKHRKALISRTTGQARLSPPALAGILAGCQRRGFPA
jgi:hypothetical protein